MNQDSASGSGVRRLRERQRESTASEILSAAEKIFAERGFYETHMADIAAQAGVAVGTLYNHYKDRDALLSALIEQRKIELIKRIDEHFVRLDGLPFRDQLREVLHVIFSHFDEHFQIFSTVTQGECGPTHIAIPSKKIQREIYERFDALVERGRQQQLLKPAIAKLAPALLMGMTRSIMIRRIFVPEEGSPLAHIETLLDFFFEGAQVATPPAALEPASSASSAPSTPIAPKTPRSRRERSTTP